MFDFRIVATIDGNQVIDRNLKTPYSALTPMQMIEYMEVDATLYLMDRTEHRTRLEADRRKRIARNPLYRIACMCGLL